MKITVTQEPVVPVVRDAVVTIKLSPLVAEGLKELLMDELDWVDMEGKYKLPVDTLNDLYDAFRAAANSQERP